MSISLGELGTAIINDKNLAIYPSQTGKAGKFLKTNGTTASWEDGGGGGTNVDGFLSGVSLNATMNSATLLTFTRHNNSNTALSIPKYNINTGLTLFSNGTLTLSQQNNPNKILNILPSYTSNSGKFLTTDGTNLSWADAGGSGGGGATIPSQTSNSGKFLTTDGTDLSWADAGGGGGTNVDGFLSGVSLNDSMNFATLLTFTRHNNSNTALNIPKYNINTGLTLFSNGTLTLSQQNNPDKILNILPSYTSNSGKFLTTDGTNLSWADAGGGGGGVSCANQKLLTVTSEGVIDLPNIKIGSSTGGTSSNTFIGEYTGPDGNASNSTCFGVYAGAQAGILDESTHVGWKAGYLATDSRIVTCIGAQAGAYRQGDYTTCIGRKAGCLSNSTDGATSANYSHNTYIGNEAGEGHTTGSYNIMIGSGTKAVSANKKLLIGYNGNNIIDGTMEGGAAWSNLTINAQCDINGKLKLLKTTDVLEFGDGTQLSSFPSQTSNSGKFLTTDGTDLSWGDGGTNVDGFLSGVSINTSSMNFASVLTFTRHNSSNTAINVPKYNINTGLTTFNNGTLTLSQQNNPDKILNILPSYTSNSGKFLTTDGTNLSWADAGGQDISCANQKLLTVSSEGVIDLPNIKIGSSTGSSTTNTFIGEYTGPDGNASNSTCFGVYAGSQAGILDESTHVGCKAGYLATTSRQATCIGAEAGAYRQGDYTTCIGRKAGCLSNTTDGAASSGSVHNTYIGNEAGEGHKTGNYNIMIGSKVTAEPAYNKLLIGYNNNHIIDGTIDAPAFSTLTFNALCNINGKLKLLNTTNVLEFGDGTQLSSFPSQTSNSGKFLTTDGTNLSWGDSTIPSQTSNSGKFLTTDGTDLSWGSTIPYNNTHWTSMFIGSQAGPSSGDGVGVTAVGYYSGRQGGGRYNTYLGQAAGAAFNGDDNTMIGYASGSGLARNGANNTFLGYQAGYGTSGDNNIMIGHSVGHNEVDADNRLMIGKSTHLLLDGKIPTSSTEGELFINASTIELPSSSLPTAYDGSYPNRIWSNQGLITIGQSISVSSSSYQALDMSTTDPNGYGRGIRRDVIVENCCFSKDANAIANLFNGKRGSGGGTGGTEGNYHYYLREGGALIFTHITYGFNWNTFYMVKSWETGSYDAIFKVYGSDNKADWTELASGSWNNWTTWTPNPGDSGINFNGSGNLVYRKLQWSQDVTKYYRHYMFKCHSGQSRHTYHQHGFDVVMGAMYELEWGRE